jgi:hypothetical protein
MDLKQMFLAQLEREAVATRRTLKRVAEGRNDWKPHEKSMTLGYLSGLVASMPGWAEFTIERDELHLSHPSAEPFKAKVLENRTELLKTLDDGLIKSRKALERTPTSASRGLGASLWEAGFCPTHRDTWP